jgi:hypothetical protein
MSNGAEFYHYRGYWFGEGTDQSWRGLSDEQIKAQFKFCCVCGSALQETDRSYRLTAGFNRLTGEQAYDEIVQIYWQCPQHLGCADQSKLDISPSLKGDCKCGITRHDAYPLSARGKYGVASK